VLILLPPSEGKAEPEAGAPVDLGALAFGAELREQREAVITLARMGWGQDNPVYRQIFSQTFIPSASPEELDWFNTFQRRTASPSNAVRFLEAFSRIDVRHRLATIKAPVLVIHARDDQRVPLIHGIELASRIPNGAGNFASGG